MKEILRNGIINGEADVPQSFNYYKSGILSNDYVKEIEEMFWLSADTDLDGIKLKDIDSNPLSSKDEKWTQM